MRHPAPGEVGDVAETVHAAQVDEQTVVGDVGDGAADNLAFLQGGAHLLAQRGPLALEDGPAGNDHVVALAVELEDLELEGLTDERIQVLDRAEIDLRIGQERRHADIHGHTAFHPVFNTALNGPVLFLDSGNLLPDLDGNGFFAGQQQAALVLPFLDEDLELVADLDLPGRILVAEFGERDKAFRLVADVDEDGVVAQSNDGAHGNLTDIDDGVVVFLLEQFRKAHFLKTGVICRKGGLSSVFCHGCSCGGRFRPFLGLMMRGEAQRPSGVVDYALYQSLF